MTTYYRSRPPALTGADSKTKIFGEKQSSEMNPSEKWKYWDQLSRNIEKLKYLVREDIGEDAAQK